MAIDNFSVSFSSTEKCLSEINEILNDIQSKLRDNSVLDKHEELKRILFQRLLIQYTQEFNDNAERLWNTVITKHKKLQHYNDTKRSLFNQYIGFTDVVVMIHGVKKYNEITESDNYQTCKKFWNERHITAHPKNNPETKLSLESFKTENVLDKSAKLFDEIITSLQSC